ncbi:MAG: hypothetical protein AAF297_09835 [Planctomycetota bacterium]
MFALLQIVLGAAFVLAFGSVGRSLSTQGDVERWRSLGAQSWGVATPDDWSGVRCVLELFDAAEAAAGAAPDRSHGPFGGRRVEYVAGYESILVGYELEDPELVAQTEAIDAARAAPALAAIEAMRTNGLFDAIAALRGLHPVYEHWDQSPPGSGWDVTPSSGLFDLIDLRILSHALIRAADEDLAAGDELSAVACVAHSWTLARVLVHQPHLGARATGAAVYGSGLRWVLDAVNHGRLSVAAVDALRGELEMHAPPSLGPMFLGESLLAKANLASLDANGWLIMFNAAAQYRPVERHYRRLSGAAVLPVRDGVRASDAASAAMDQLWFWRYPMAKTSVIWGSGWIVQYASLETMRRAVRVALALEGYRLRNGEFPPELRSVGGLADEALIADVFNIGGLVYRVGADPTLPAAGGGCALYALGFDGVDDGGRGYVGRRSLAYDLDASGEDDVFLGSIEAKSEGGSR